MTADTGTLRAEFRRAPTWVWIVLAVGVIVIGVGAIGALVDRNKSYSVTAEFGSLRMAISGPALSAGVLVVPVELTNTEGQDRYDYDAAKSFSVNFTGQGKIYPSSIEGINPGTLAPKESRAVRLLYTVPAGECPNNLHFQAQGSSSSGDIALKEVGCK